MSAKKSPTSGEAGRANPLARAEETFSGGHSSAPNAADDAAGEQKRRADNYGQQQAEPEQKASHAGTLSALRGSLFASMSAYRSLMVMPSTNSGASLWKCSGDAQLR